MKPETLDFLARLKKNNNREWFEKNRNLFENAKADFESFVQSLISASGKMEPGFSDLEPKDCIFRIYRDVRFSKNKDPYKINFGAYLCKGGKKTDNPGYYIQLQPDGNSFAAGGCWMPDPPKLKGIRQEIQYHTDEFKKIIGHKSFVSTFGKLTEAKLKTVPKGFSKDDPNLELFKYTSYIVEHKFSDKEVLSGDFVRQNVAVLKAMQPLLGFLNRAIS